MGELVALSYAELQDYWRKGLRNGNWHHLGIMDRIFYRAATWYAKTKSTIMNDGIIAKLRTIAEKLKAAIKGRLMDAGIERVREMTTRFEPNGVFKWVPQLRTWLKDSSYVLWLGLSSQLPHGS
jgi:hypothetical protein